MKQVKGDLIKLALAGEFDVIIHGCNCFCAMGAGIARQIRATFPQAYDADCQTTPGDRSKLGTYTHAQIDNQGTSLFVVNGYTQYHYDGNGVLSDYDAISALFLALGKEFTGKRFGYPKIGAGLAGGDWAVISGLIDKAMDGEDHTLVEFSRE
ncbi:MAG: phosphatase [Desulfobacter sp.]